MRIIGKITRFLLKTIGILFLIVVFALIGLYFAIQSHSFQTYLAKRASDYLSNELNTKISIDKIKIDFFSNAKIEKLLVFDLYNDTLIFANLNVDIKELNYEAQRVRLKSINLENTTAKIINYKDEKDLNFDFIINYFDNGKVTRKTKIDKKWDIDFGDVNLKNLSFVYKNLNDTQLVNQNMNFSNLCFTNINGKFSNIKLDADVTQMQIQNFSAKEQCGFELNNLTAITKVSSEELFLSNLYLKTPQSLLKGRIEFYYNEWKDYAEFIDKIKINSELKDSTKVNFKDVAYFTETLNCFDKEVQLNGLIDGFVSDLNLEKFNLTLGKHTCFKGDLRLTGLPVFKTTYLKFNTTQLSTSFSDLSDFPNYPFCANKKLELPSQLKSLGILNYVGKFDGFINNFKSVGILNTALGKVTTDVGIKIGNESKDFTYEGKINTYNFNVGALVGMRELSNVSLNTNVKGKGLDLDNLNTVLDGDLLTATYNGYTYKNIKLNGAFKDKLFKGVVKSNDPNANFDFNGNINFKNKVPEMDFISSVNNLNLSVLNLSEKTKADSGSISTQMLINLKGDNLNNMSGQINFDDTKYKTKTKSYRLSTLNLDLDQSKPDKSINLTSAYLNASAKGKFNILNLQPAFENFLYKYYPTFFSKPLGDKTFTDEVKFNATIKNFKTIKELFLPELMLAPKTMLDGSFNASKNSFGLTFISDSVNYNGIKIQKLNLLSKEEADKVVATIIGERLNLTDSIGIDNFNLCINSLDKNTKYDFEWDSKRIVNNNKGELAGMVIFNNQSIYLQHDTISLTYRDSTWNLIKSNPSVINLDGNYFINPLLFSNNQQLIGLSGTISEKPSDKLIINTKNVLLNQFNPILSPYKLNLDGILTGNVALDMENKQIIVDADLEFAKLKINNNLLGLLKLKSEFNPIKKAIYLDGSTSLGLPDMFGNETKNISFNGNYYLDNRDESIDIDFGASPANLKLLNPYLEGIMKIENAYVFGKGKMHGNPSNIKIDGKLKLTDSEIKIDYTNVTYKIKGDVEIEPDLIRFIDLEMSEKSLGPKATPQGTINGVLFHNNFSNMKLDYDVNYRNMMVMNTTEKDNSTFYGKMYGTGRFGIYGFLNLLHMSVDYTSEKNSKFIMPLDGPSEVGDNDFIRFVKRDTVKVEEDKISSFDLEMNVKATPDLNTKIILDKVTGDGLNAQGYGDLKLNISTLGKFDMVGDYLITNGNYIFTLENVINKKFDIEAGSNISWSGDPLNAEINVTTSYKQRAIVAPLLPESTDKGRYAVDCKLLITNKLFKPIINFKIDFPTLDVTSKSRINNVLSDEVELNRQVFSFLLFRSFVTPAVYSSGGGVTTAGSAAASTGSEMLSNRLSNFLNGYVGNLTGLSDLQVGVNYRTGAANSGQAVDLALSKQFLNNRISVDGNFGVNGGNTQSRNGLIGDVNIDYKITEDGRYRVRGFNRTNDNTQITTLGGPYTQGIGIFYRREFENFEDLMKRKKAEKEKKENQEKK